MAALEAEAEAEAELELQHLRERTRVLFDALATVRRLAVGTEEALGERKSIPLSVLVGLVHQVEALALDAMEGGRE